MEFKEYDLSLIFKALKFSSRKHRDQRRKDREASPYINHPIDVAETLLRVGRIKDISTIIAAILHDTIEDTDTTPEEIQDLFGVEVLSLVKEVSDDKTLSKETRKRLQIENAPRASIKAKQIKLADKICNVSDITNSPPSNWSLERRAEYLEWTEKVVAGLRGTNRSLEGLYDAVLAIGKKQVEQDRLSE